MAEAILKKKLEELGLKGEIEASSAGVYAIDGKGASLEAIEIVNEHGGDLSGHISKQLNTWMVHESDYIFTMTFSQKRSVIQMCPDAYEKVFVLKEFVAPEVMEKAKGLAELYKEAGLAYSKLYGPETGEEKPGDERDKLDEIEQKIKEKEKDFIIYDVQDPFGGSREDYEKIYREIDSAIEGILDVLKAKIKK